MIGYLKGSIVDKNEKSLILLVGNVGYKIHSPHPVLAEEAIGKELSLYIHTSVKENDISLYGFLSKEELDLFEKLISVSGVGPKIGLEIVSSPAHLIKTAILNRDIQTLSKVKGLGKKTAEKITIELKNKITPSYQKGDKDDPEINQVNQEAVMALESLGYERFHILKIMTKLPEEIKETEDIVKFVLKSQS